MTIRFVSRMLRYPAADRNKDVILEVFKSVLTNECKLWNQLKALEIGSGSGQHITHLAHHLPNILWQPSDIDTRLFESIESYAKSLSLKNVLPPIWIDVSQPINQWPIPPSTKLDLIVCINVIHISPWNCTEGIFKSCSLLSPNGLLLTYGPYASDGVLTPESNVNFDQQLRYQNPEWGVRDIRDLKILAQNNGLTLISTYEMPANNKVLVFKKLD